MTFATAAATRTSTDNNIGTLTLTSLTVNTTNSNTAWSISGSALIVPTISVASGYTLTTTAALGTSGTPIGTMALSGGGLLDLQGTSFANSTSLSGTGTTLRVNATLTGASAGAVTVGTGTILGGNGSITNSPVTVNGTSSSNTGTIDPGSASATTGTLTLPATTFTANSTYGVDIGSFSTLTNVDKITVSGALTFTTGSFLNLTRLSGAGAAPTDGVTRVYTIGSATTINGQSSGTTTLGQFTVGGSNSGPNVSISASGFVSGDIFTLRQNTTNLQLVYTPTPEPAAVLGVFLVVVGFAARRWRVRLS